MYKYQKLGIYNNKYPLLSSEYGLSFIGKNCHIEN